jgi:hypothetical protein
MRIVYHPDSATMSDYALGQWLSATLAAIDNPPAPGIALDLGNPDYPWSFEPEYLADDRETSGGKCFSRIRATRLQGMLNMSAVHSGELPAWRGWYAATLGFRRPFALRLPELTVLGAVAPVKKFPLALVSLEEWAGQINVVEWL